MESPLFSPPSSADLEELLVALMSLEDPHEGYEFLMDLCSASELTAMRERWTIAQALWSGAPYKQIESETCTSSTTIARVARSLFRPKSGYGALLNRLQPRAGHLRGDFLDKV